MSKGARPEGLDPIIVGEAISQRARSFVVAVGYRRAIVRLGAGKATIEAAMQRGRMQRTTYARFIEALEREERKSA